MSAMLKLHRQCKKIVTSSSIFQTRLQQTQIKPKPHVGPRLTDIVPVFRKAASFSNRTALRDLYGSYTYANLFVSAKELSREITKNLNGKTDQQVLFLCPNDANYVITQWAIWMSGHIAVPMNSVHPQNMLEYYAKDCDSKLLVTTREHADLMQKVAKSCDKPLYVLDEKLQENALQKGAGKQSDLEGGQSPDFYNKKNAMILYTSGTTGNPKGVVLTHKNIISQVHTLIDAWKWTSNDVILHVLPLHHVHGIVNALLCPLYVGAKCSMLPKYDSNNVWSSLLGVNAQPDDRKITVFMAVPTIYAKLIDEYERVFSKDSKMTEYIKMTLKTKMRLIVSGSAPLPVPLYEKWLDVTGHNLLERYGMTEIGMCLSHEYDSQREPGYVGIPLPGVSVRLGQLSEEDEGDFTFLLDCTNNNGDIQLKMNKSITFKEDPVGELLVKGDGVFKEYFNRPEATQNEFTTGKWFKTGDMCQYSREKKLFKILGRSNIDIIKTGGYKVSALEIETQLLGHPDIADCAVVGLVDETWGEKVAAVVVLRKGTKLTLDTLKIWAKGEMTDYTVPRVLKVVETIPKNSMGKINKRELVAKIFP